MTFDCETPADGTPRCPLLDNAEEEIHALINVAALERFANPTNLPPFPEWRRIQLLKVWSRIARVPAQRSRHHADLWPRPAPAARHVHDSSVPRKELR